MKIESGSRFGQKEGHLSHETARLTTIRTPVRYSVIKLQSPVEKLVKHSKGQILQTTHSNQYRVQCNSDFEHSVTAANNHQKRTTNAGKTLIEQRQPLRFQQKPMIEQDDVQQIVST